MPFTGIGSGKYKSPSGRIFTAKQVKLYYATDGFKNMKGRKHKKQRKVDNKMRSFGDFDEATGKIRVNKKMAAKSRKEKGNYPELLDTIVHEEYHKKNPKASEKTTRKVTKRIIKKLTSKAKKRLYGKYQ